MKLTNMRGLFAVLFVGLLFCSVAGFGQGMGMSDNPIYKPYYDSLKQMNYPYKLPILGKQAYKRGYDIQYAYGISGIYFTQRQDIDIQSIQIGFNGSQMVDLSNFIKFGPTVANTNAYTVRPDIWLLPFLNVYGIIGGGTTETNVSLIEPIGFETVQNFKADSYGLGVTLAGAVGPIFLAWDNNYNFVDVEAIVEPMPAFNSSLRIGHTIMSPSKPQKSLSVWGGVFYQSLQNDTKGSLNLTEIFPDFGNGFVFDSLRDWSATLPPAQRLVANQIIDALEEMSNGVDVENATVDYLLEKKVAAPFNLIFGAQYQFNKHWILRTELGVFGKRSQFLLNLNYRIPGLKKVR